MKNIVVLSAARTPVGSFLGKLSSLSAPALGSTAIRAALDRAGVKPSDVEQVIMGNILQAGIGQAPARQASLGAGIPDSVPCITLNKVCGSGMRAVMDASNAIQAGEYELAVAGGMESMSNAPYILERARSGYRMGNAALVDSMIKDGLWDPYKDIHMGNCAEMCAGKYHFTREEQDSYRPGVLQARAERLEDVSLLRGDRARRGAAEEGGPDPDRRGRGALRGAAREDRQP